MGIYTNTMRYTGTSGVDVESMVQALMKAEGTKADRLYREKQKLDWTQQMFRDMGTSVKTFNNSYLSFSSTSTIANMRSSATYSNKSVTGKFSGGEIISTGSSKNSLNIGGNSTISTTSNTAAGDYEINVKSVATGDSYQSQKKSSDIVSNTKVDTIISKTLADPATGIQAGDYLDIKINGSTKSLTITEDDLTRIQNAGNTATGGTVSKASEEFVNILQEKIDTQFGTITTTDAGKPVETQHKVNVSINSDGKLNFSPNSKVGTTLTINPPKNPTKIQPITSGNALMDNTDISDDGVTFKVGGSDTYVINEMYLAVVRYDEGDTAQDYVDKLNQELELHKENGINITAKLEDDGKISIYKGSLSEPDIQIKELNRVTSDGLRTKPGLDFAGTTTTSTSLFEKFEFSTTSNTSTFNVNQKIDASMTGPITENIKVGSSNIAVKIDANTTYKDVMNQINASGKASLTFNTNTNGFTLQSKELGENGKITFESGSKVAEAFQLDEANGGVHKAATNAEVHVKGPNGIDQTLIRETNSFSYADINFKLDPNLQSKIDAQGVDDAGNKKGLTIEMTVNTNTNQSYDNIKGFIDAYNTLVDQLSSATNTRRAKSGDYSYYEPLTEAEKEGMSDAQIEKLEGKAKEGMLYRNPELTRLQNKLREITTTQVTLEDGTKMSLAKIGITTGDYSQGGKLFIDEDKLRTALENNSDGVAKLFTDSKNGVAEKVYKSINDAVGSNGYITKKVGFTDSIYVKNNYYSKQSEQKSKELERMNDYLIGKENYYYSMFANMEKVITESNNQMASLMNY